LTEAEIATLSSLEQVDDYPLYVMHYQGAYSRQASLEGGGGLAAGAQPPAWACSLFAALGDADNMLYGRNFDWRFSPALLLFTDPPDGYASVSMVDIDYLGFSGDRAQGVADLPLTERQSLLDTPFWPFDGMNERGVAVGMAAVSEEKMPRDPAKETIGSLGVIREILDHAADVDEALAILQSYNIDWGGGPALHYLVADLSGRSYLVEFYDGEMVIMPNEASWQHATNLIRAAAGDSPEGECWRFDRITQRLADTEGQLTSAEAMDLLADVAQDGTQWSIVYGMSSGEIDASMGQQYRETHTFQLDLAEDRPKPAVAASPEGENLRMSVVYDNTTYKRGLRAEWGFAAWLEYGDHTLLFDTGGNGFVLLSNMEKLGLDPQEIEAIILSHEHGDHVDGLGPLLDAGIQPVVYIPAYFSKSFKDGVRAQTEVVEVSDPVEIVPGLHSTGEISGAMREQGLIVETPEGLVVITGCAHPGIVKMVRTSKEIVDGEVALVVGGFHLGNQAASTVKGIIDDLRDLGVKRVSPTHCTGDRSIQIFAELYGKDYIEGGVGQVFVNGTMAP
jgi:metal-dependent hydrolase (beta-lactamase superfamily II)